MDLEKPEEENFFAVLDLEKPEEDEVEEKVDQNGKVEEEGVDPEIDGPTPGALAVSP